MERTRARITYGIIGGTLCLAAWAATATPLRTPSVQPSHLTSNDPPLPTQTHITQQLSIPKAPPRVEVVFALDTTGSMSGLIDGAKRKIWSLAQYIANGDPKPEVRIGLVAYRDRGDAYVTRFYDLSGDLDQVFAHLQSFEADGGGDGPEDVNRALSDAIDRASWSQGQNVLKLIYVVGDAPPHDDYGDQPDSRALARRAHERGIRINTVRCGSDSSTQVAFARISNLAAGEYASIEQTGGVRTIDTPYDEKLAGLNAKLMGTAIGYGAKGEEMRRKVSLNLSAPRSMAADRASYFGATGGAVSGEGDLVKDVAEGRIRADAVAPSALPAAIAAMPASERGAYVAGKQRERDDIQREINSLAVERNAYLKKAPAKSDSFDGAVQSTLKRQAHAVGVAY